MQSEGYNIKPLLALDSVCQLLEIFLESNIINIFKQMAQKLNEH